MATILAVGNATLDIVNVVSTYPREDEEVRALSQYRRRGGNATNTLAVLSQLGHRCAWAGVLAEEPDAVPILEDLTRHAIDTTAVNRLTRGKVPTSYVTLSQENGSRTIVHYRDLPEYPHARFAEIDLSPFDWVHFEGRNVHETGLMLERLKRQRPELPCSLEVEKPRPEIEGLFGTPDLLLFSRAYAASRGFRASDEFLARMHGLAPQADLVCAWGEKGAYGLSRGGAPCTSPAFPPPLMVDSLGAGDVFNAGVIHHCLRGAPLERGLIEAARLAGHSCGQHGLEGLVGE